MMISDIIADLIARLPQDARTFLRDEAPLPSAEGMSDLASWGLVTLRHLPTGALLVTVTDSGKVVGRELRAQGGST